MLRKVGLVALGLVGGCVGLFAAAFAVAQTGPAKDQISDLVAGTLSNPGRQAEVEQLSGLLPFDIRLGRFALRDDKGVWLEVNDARVKLSPSALLKGEVHVEEAGAARVAVDRLPPPGPDEPASTEPFRLPETPTLPESLPLVRLDRLHVDRIELGEAVAGQAAVFSLEGRGGTGEAGKAPGLNLALRRTDQPTAALDLDARLDLAARTLGIRLTGSETGGLMAGLTKQPQAGALNLSLEGSGPLDDWRGKLLADVERLARLEADLDLAYASTRRVRVDAAFTAAPGVLPASIAPVVGERATLALQAGETAPGVFAVDRLQLQAAALGLTGTGTADVNADRLQGRAELSVPALAELSGLAGVPLAGAARLTLDASGRVAEPALRLGLDGTGIAADRVALASLGGGYDVTLLRSAEGAVAGARVAGALTAEGLAVEGRPVGDGRASLDVRAEVPPTGQVRVERLALASGLASLDLTGAVDRATLAGEAKLTGAVPDLAAVLALLPPDATAGAPPVTGSLALDGSATLGDQANRIDARLGITGQNLAGLPPAAQALLGPAPRIDAKALVEQRKAVTVQELRLNGAAATLAGNPTLGLERQLGGQLRLELPDLARLEPALQQPVAGRVTATADLGGTLDAPAITLDAAGDGLLFGTQAVDRLTLAGRSEGPVASPAGTLALTATRAGQGLALAADFALADGRLRLPKVELTGPQTRLAGDAEVELGRALATGRLAGGVGDLAALSAWTQQQGLAGAVDLDATFAAPDGRQDATLKVAARNVAGSFGRLGSATLDGSVRDALGAPALDADLAVAGFARPGLEVREAALAAEGPLDRLGLTLSAAGTQGAQPLDLRAKAEVAALGPAKSVLLQSFGGDVAGQRVELAAPARLSLDQGVLDLDQLDLKVGPARLSGSLRHGAGRVRGEVRLASLPLGALEAFGAPPLEGSARGRLRLDGTTAAPAATLELDVSDLQPAGAGDKAPAADLRLTAKAGGDGLDAELAAEGLGERPLVAEAGLPLRFSLEPFAFALPRGSALSGTLRGPVDLARVATLAALDGQIVKGVLNADLRLRGTLDRPTLGGGLTLRDGRVDDLLTGASFRDVTLTAEAAGREVTLSELSAADRYGGRITGRGSAALDDALRPDFDLSLKLDRARLLDGDLGAAVVTGDVGVDGGAEAAKVVARLRVDEADIRIPDAGGTATVPPQLDVVEKGREADIAPEAGPGGYPVRLDARLDVPGRFFVRGRGLESEWAGELRATGTADAPEVRGEIRHRRGHLDLLAQRFAITRAVVAFTGGQPPVPQLDFEAAVQQAEVKSIVRVRGPATDPKLELTSEPQLPQDEILARILFGRAKDRITPVQGLRLAAAAQQLRGGGPGVLDRLRGAAGIDTLDVEGGATAAESSASVGKYVNDRVYLELQRGVQPGTGKARVEVELTPNLSVGTDVTERSRTGVDLQWRYDY